MSKIGPFWTGILATSLGGVVGLGLSLVGGMPTTQAQRESLAIRAVLLPLAGSVLAGGFVAKAVAPTVPVAVTGLLYRRGK